MPKFYGKIGYSTTRETSPGVWEDKIIERDCSGDLVRNKQQFIFSDSVNDNVNVSNELSIVADPYARENFGYMKYVKFMGAKWKIQSVEVQYPRLILTIGGIYNG